MHQLVSEISTKLGVSEETAQHAVDIVVEYLKTKLPAPLAAQLENVLCAGTPAEGAAAESSTAETGIAGMVGKLFK
jgi:hypothetical protein